MILLSVNALLSDGHLSPHTSGLEALIKTIFFPTKVCYSGLHFVAKSNYFSNTQTSQMRPKIDGVRSSVIYSIRSRVFHGELLHDLVYEVQREGHPPNLATFDLT